MRRFSLLALTLALALAGCGGKATSSGPAWPASAGWVTPATWQEDGGESIEPRVTDEVAAIESSDDPSGDTTVDVDIDPTIDDTFLEEVPAVDAPPPPFDETYVPEETIIIEGELPP